MVVFSTGTSLVQLIAPNEMRGRVMSIYMLRSAVGCRLGSLSAGISATYLGAPLVIGINADCSSASPIYFLTRNHGVLEREDTRSSPRRQVCTIARVSDHPMNARRYSRTSRVPV